LLKAQYAISLVEGYSVVKNIAPQVLINHVHTTMHTTTHKNHSITREMVKERISVYSDRLNQSNASKYFMRNAIHYDPNTGSYKNVSFSNAIAKSYEGNVMEESTRFCDVDVDVPTNMHGAALKKTDFTIYNS